MAELKTYKVKVNGLETELQLTEDHARKIGVLDGEVKADTKAAKAPANKARTATNKAAE